MRRAIVRVLMSLLRRRMAPRSTRQTGSQRRLRGNARSFLSRYIVESQDSHLTFSDQISSLSNTCFYHIRELRCIRPYLDFKTASTIATSIVLSKLDYCNSVLQPSKISNKSS